MLETPSHSKQPVSTAAQGTPPTELQHRVLELEKALNDLRLDEEQSRSELLKQQDAFIAELISDYESTLTSLRKELIQTRQRHGEHTASEDLGLTPQSTSAALAGLHRNWAQAEHEINQLVAARKLSQQLLLRLQEQRDQAQNAVLRLIAERDAAQAELERYKEVNAATLPPPIADTGAPSAPFDAGGPLASKVPASSEPPRPEQRGAKAKATNDPAATAYSVSGKTLRTERLEGARMSSKPPR